MIVFGIWVLVGVFSGLSLPWATNLFLLRSCRRSGEQTISASDKVLIQPTLVECIFFVSLEVLVFVAIAFSLKPPLLSVCFAVCVTFMIIGIVCDLKARLLPIECSIAIALAGVIIQIFLAGFWELVYGAIVGVVIYVLCVVLNTVAERRGRLGFVGRGDMFCMSALSIATGFGALYGLVVCCVAAAAFSLFGVAIGKLGLKDGIPLAPFLALWMPVGFLIGV